ncbi:hypothetical protein ACLKA6_012522 [Drosophila palustris]
MKSMKGKSNTGFNIRSKIDDILKSFGCDLEEDSPVFVTDRGSNMVAAFRDTEKIHCINHLLNNVIEGAIKAVPEMAEIVAICSCYSLLHATSFYFRYGACCLHNSPVFHSPSGFPKESLHFGDFVLLIIIVVVVVFLFLCR